MLIVENVAKKLCFPFVQEICNDREEYAQIAINCSLRHCRTERFKRNTMNRCMNHISYQLVVSFGTVLVFFSTYYQ